MESILSSIYVYRVHDYVEQIAVVSSLENFLKEHPKVKLVCLCVILLVPAGPPPFLKREARENRETGVYVPGLRNRRLCVHTW